MYVPKVRTDYGVPSHLGEDNPRSKLKEWMVRDIRFVFAITTQPQRAIKLMSEYYGVSKGTITDVRLRRTWRHV